jgi:hypothetical protein
MLASLGAVSIGCHSLICLSCVSKQYFRNEHARVVFPFASPCGLVADWFNLDHAFLSDLAKVNATDFPDVVSLSDNVTGAHLSLLCVL